MKSRVLSSTTHTPLDNLLFGLPSQAADGPPLVPLPFKVKQTLHSASPHSHRERKLVFSHLGSFFLFHPMLPWERSFLFGHPNSGQAHAVQCCIHTVSLPLPRSRTSPFFRGSLIIRMHSHCLTSKSCDLLPESMRQPYYPC